MSARLRHALPLMGVFSTRSLSPAVLAEAFRRHSQVQQRQKMKHPPADVLQRVGCQVSVG